MSEEVATVNIPLELFGNRLLITRDDKLEQSEGGIILPTDARERSMTGKVVAVGPGMRKADGTYMPMIVKPGDVVLFEQFRQMIEVKLNGVTYHIMNENDIIGRVTGNVTVKGGNAV